MIHVHGHRNSANDSIGIPRRTQNSFRRQVTVCKSAQRQPSLGLLRIRIRATELRLWTTRGVRPLHCAECRQTFWNTHLHPPASWRLGRGSSRETSSCFHSHYCSPARPHDVWMAQGIAGPAGDIVECRLVRGKGKAWRLATANDTPSLRDKATIPTSVFACSYDPTSRRDQADVPSAAIKRGCGHGQRRVSQREKTTVKTCNKRADVT